MKYTTIYPSVLGDIVLACDETGLTGLWFQDQKHFALTLTSEYISVEPTSSLPEILSKSIEWLNLYFLGNIPDFMPPIHLSGSAFQQDVWKLLLQIPYGETITYGKIASLLAKQRGISSMSAQAVGNAVGKNPVSIIVPCHRVIGANGKLTGYAGGLDRKEYMLTLEKNRMD